METTPVFHIGVNMNNRIKSKKNITKYKNNKIVRQYYINKHINLNKQSNSRQWTIPSGLIVSKSIMYKFMLISSYSHLEINNKINEMLCISKLKPLFSIIGAWVPPECVTSYIQDSIKKECDEWLKVKAIYSKIIKLVIRIRKLCNIMKIKRALRNVMNKSDPVTLEDPVKPIHIINFKAKCSYVYELDTIRKTINNRLLLSDYMFPNPQLPVNILSNEPFTYYQLLSIYSQFKKYGVCSWVFDRFKACNFNLEKFSLYYRQQLKIRAIEQFFTVENDLYQESVLDYFLLSDDTILTNADDTDYYTVFKRALYSKNHSPYIKRWIATTKRYYIAKELQDSIQIKSVLLLTDNLFSEMDIYL